MAVMARERRLVIPRSACAVPTGVVGWEGDRLRRPDHRRGAVCRAFVWMVSGSVQQIGDIFRWPPQWIPRNPTSTTTPGSSISGSTASSSTAPTWPSPSPSSSS